jgi:hypothetical protein
MTKKKPMYSNNYSNININGLIEDLRRLPPVNRARRTHTKRHVIEQLREHLLDALLTRGYTYTELVDWLRERGITLHVYTLRKYLGSLSEQRNRAERAPAPASPRVPPTPRANRLRR